MGLFGFIKKTLDDLDAKRKLEMRDISGSEDKLRRFVEKYPGEVINASIPISIEYVNNKYNNSGTVVEYYVRVEYFDGRTRFEWFQNLSDARLFRDDSLGDGRSSKVVGPYHINGEFR